MILNRRSNYLAKINSFYVPLVSLVIGFGASYVLLNLSVDIYSGGNPWKQGDWLINREAFEIRRGPLGSLFLDISDVLGVNPLQVVGAVQAALIISLYALVGWILVKIPRNSISLLLIISPAFFLIFWVVDLQGGLRKELMAYAALAFLIVGFSLNRLIPFFISCVLLMVGFYGHELNILFLPLFLLLVFCGSEGQSDRNSYLFGAVVTTMVAIHASYYAIANNLILDAGPICQALVERGINAQLCSGAISWLERDAAYGFGEVVIRTTFTSFIQFVVAYFLALAPLIYFALHLSKRNEILTISFILGLPFIPLYFIAVDWGRWMNFHIVSIVFFIMTVLLTNRATVDRAPRPVIFIVIVCSGVLWAPMHTYGVINGGIIKTLLFKVSSF